MSINLCYSSPKIDFSLLKGEKLNILDRKNTNKYSLVDHVWST